MAIPRFLRAGPKQPDKTDPSAINAYVDMLKWFAVLVGERPPPCAPPAVKEKTRLQQFLARLRPSLSRETGIRLISLNIVRAHARTGRGLDLDWD